MNRASVMIALLVSFTVMAACMRTPDSFPRDASTAPPAEVHQPATDAEGELWLSQTCSSCHAVELVMTQRLTAAQWTGTLHKMNGWGAPVPECDVERWSTWLAKVRGPGAVIPAATAVTEAAALESVLPRPDPSGWPGDASRGRALYSSRCVACHGPDARGGVGMNLVDKPILFQAARVVDVVQRGRGLMPPHPDFSAAQVADVLAYLRGLGR